MRRYPRSMLWQQGSPAMQCAYRTTFRVVKRFADHQFFRAGGLLIETHAFLAMGNQLGVA